MSKDTQSQLAKEALIKLGFNTKIVPEDKIKTADLIIEHQGTTALVEVKSFIGDSAEEDAFWGKVSKNGSSSSNRVVENSGSISKSLRYAAKQLSENRLSCNYFGLWLVAAGPQPDLNMELLEATLLGTQKLISLDPSPLLTCYFFHDSEFFRCRETLDFAFVCNLSEAKLTVKGYLNPYSPRFKEMSTGGFFSKIEPKMSDPSKANAKMGHLSLNATHPRNDIDASLSHLKGEYGFSHLQVMTMTSRRHAVNVSENSS